MTDNMRATYKIEVKKLCRDRLRDFIRTSFGETKRSTAHVLCFAGREALEISEVYLSLGIPPDNIVCLEKRREVCNELKRRSLGIRIRHQTLDEFIDSPREGRFDIVSLDFTGQIGTYENQLYRLKKRGFLEDDAIVFTNFCGAREADASKGCYHLARQRMASPIGPFELASIIKRCGRARDPDRTLRKALQALDRAQIEPFWEESLAEQRSAGIHASVRMALTQESWGLSNILHRQKDEDGSLSERAREWADFARSLRDLPPEVLKVMKQARKASERKDDALPAMMMVELTQEVEARLRAQVRKIAKGAQQVTFDVDFIVQLLGGAIDTFLGSPYHVLATQSCKYVSDRGTPMYADLFHLRRISECDFLAELLPRDAPSVEELLEPVRRLPFRRFQRLIEKIHQQAISIGKAERAQPGTPSRLELGRESRIRPAREPLPQDVRSMKAGALKLLTESPHLTIEDIAVTLGAKRMQVAAWKAHMTMGTYCSSSRSVLETLADQAYYAGRYCESLELSSRLLKRASRSVRLLNNRAVVLQCLGRFRAALAIVDRALRIKSDDYNLLHNRAVLLDELRRDTEAADAYMRAAQAEPRNAELLVGLGDVLIRLSRHDEAMSRYEEALRLDPACYAAGSAKARELSERGRLNEALAQLDALLALHPGRSNTLYNRALVLVKLGRREDAICDLRAGLQLAPSDVSILYNLGCSLLEHGEAEEARSRFTQAVQLDPGHLSALINLGATCSQLEDHEAAIEAYGRVLKQQPENVDALFNRSKSLRARRRAHEALEDCNRLVKLAPERAQYRAERGMALLLSDRTERAMADFEQALARDSEDKGAMFGKALGLLIQGQHQEALELFDHLTEIQPADAWVVLGKATALFELDRTREAIEEYDKALDLDPTNARVLSDKAAALERLEKIPEALSCLEEALRLSPSNQDALYNKATLLMRHGRLADAVSTFDACLRLNPFDHQALCNRGWSKLRLADPNGAQEDFLAALGHNPDDCFASNGLKLLEDMAALALEEETAANKRSAGVETRPPRRRARRGRAKC